jgi:hypothetical protein
MLHDFVQFCQVSTKDGGLGVLDNFDRGLNFLRPLTARPERHYEVLFDFSKAN